jgi:hypothetical protein
VASGASNRGHPRYFHSTLRARHRVPAAPNHCGWATLPEDFNQCHLQNTLIIQV